MPRKKLVREQDKFMLRLPDGMRDRIKAKADRAGMSMNEAIVWVLEKEFPAPVSLEERLEDLAELVAMLKDSKNTYSGVEDLISEIEKVIGNVAANKIPTEPWFRQMVETRLQQWHEQQVHEDYLKQASPFDDASWDWKSALEEKLKDNNHD